MGDPGSWMTAYAVAGLVSVVVLATTAWEGPAAVGRRPAGGWRALLGLAVAAVVAFTCWPLLLLAALLGLDDDDESGEG